jgi:hypothetical protein
VQFNTVTASDISFRSDIIADDELDGILIQDKDPGEGAVSSITDLLIQDSYLGAAPNPLGGTFAANRGNGFAARDTSFTGVGFVESFFNGNGTSQIGGDGILFFHSRINAEPMAPPSTVPASLKPGFRLSGSQVIGNKAEGIEIDAVAATGLTIDKSIIAENALEGLFVYDTDLRDRIVSNITDFVIQTPIWVQRRILWAAASSAMAQTVSGRGFDLHRRGVPRLVLQRKQHGQCRRWRRPRLRHEHDPFGSGDIA